VSTNTHVFSNQALNTLWNYPVASSARFLEIASDFLESASKVSAKAEVRMEEASQASRQADVFITDPPYGDAVHYEEILEFFIAWLRRNPSPEFASWVWDSRRDLAVKGEDDDFRRGMVAAYRRMTELMPDNGIQIIMFTHQSGKLWADMANIVCFASGSGTKRSPATISAGN
jgi:putative DNA methylase